MSKIGTRKMGVILSYTNLIASTIIPFFYTPIMLNILGQSEYGLYGLSSSIVSYINLLNFGMGATVTRYVIKYKSDNNNDGLRNLIGLFTLIYSFLSIIIITVGFFCSFNCELFFSKGLLDYEIIKLKILILIMTFNIPVSLLGSIYSSLMLAYEKFTFKYCMDIFGTLSLPVFNLITLYMGYGSIGLSLTALMINALYMPINMFYCYKKLNIKVSFKKMPIDILKEIFTFSFIVFLSSLADLLFWATDKVLIGAYLGSVQVAIYNIGGTFTSIFQNMAHAISSVFVPMANEIVQKNRPIEESSDLLIRVGRIQYLLTSLILSGFIVFGPQFLVYWAGEGYEKSYYIALLTMIPLTVPLIQSVAYNTVLAMNKHAFRSNMYMIIAFINALTTWIVIPRFGIIGAAICTSLSYFIGQGVILNLFYWKIIKLDIPKFWHDILLMSKVPVIMMIACNFVLRILEINSLFNLMICIVIYTFIYCVMSWCFTMNEYEKGLLKGILVSFRGY